MKVNKNKNKWEVINPCPSVRRATCAAKAQAHSDI
jgi:hypothetical protein